MPIRRLSLLLALAAALAAPAAIAPAGAPAATPCWKRLLDDWVDNGRIDRAYPATCYQSAVDNLPPDVAAYSSAREDILRALRAATRANGGVPPRIIPPGTISGSAGAGAGEDSGGDRQTLPPVTPSSGPGDGGGGAAAGGDADTFLGRFFPRASTVDTVPVPLLVLAALALLLLGAAAVALASRRMQARRVRVSSGLRDGR